MLLGCYTSNFFFSKISLKSFSSPTTPPHRCIFLLLERALVINTFAALLVRCAAVSKILAISVSWFPYGWILLPSFSFKGGWWNWTACQKLWNSGWMNAVDYQCICFMSSFYDSQHSSLDFLLDGLALASSQRGGSEYIQSLLLLEKGMKSLP